MKRLIRRIAKVADALEQRKSSSSGAGGWRRRLSVPHGHVPVCVGEEMERFAVPAEIFGRPAFVELLHRSAEEYGYEHSGVLRIPCPVPIFRQLLVISASSHGVGFEVDEIFRSISDEIAL